MKKLKFVKNYRDNEQLRTSFFELANSVFGLSFERWYEQGFWKNRYIPFSFVDDKRVVANVSINIIDLIIQGEKKRALQVGTVMTHPNYRKKGLSKNLMNRVLEEYKNDFDIMYLFANESVLDFYPKFGFKIMEEYQYSMNFKSNQQPNNEIRKIDIGNNEDMEFIYEFATERTPVSNIFGTRNSGGILMYYCLNVFINDIYFSESENGIIIFNKDKNHINIFDIISKSKVNIHNILKEISGEGTNKIIFHFTPDYEGITFQRKPFKGGGTLFVKTSGNNYFPDFIKHPITSEA